MVQPYTGVCWTTHLTIVGANETGCSVQGPHERRSCSVDATCSTESSDAGTCIPFLELGQPCSNDPGGRCRYPGECIDSICTLRDPNRCR
jgi:hypothetical protein